MLHSLILGGVGFAIGVVGAITMWGVSATWYSLAIIAVTAPCAWVVGWWRVLTMLADMGRALPDEISHARDGALREGLAKDVVVPLAKQLATHVSERFATITRGH